MSARPKTNSQVFSHLLPLTGLLLLNHQDKGKPSVWCRNNGMLDERWDNWGGNVSEEKNAKHQKLEWLGRRGRKKARPALPSLGEAGLGSCGFLLHPPSTLGSCSREKVESFYGMFTAEALSYVVFYITRPSHLCFYSQCPFTIYIPYMIHVNKATQNFKIQITKANVANVTCLPRRWKQNQSLFWIRKMAPSFLAAS